MEKSEFETTNCQICNSSDLFPYRNKGQFGIPTYVVICKKCGFSFLNPRWTVNRYNKFYAKEYDRYYREETVYSPSDNRVFKSIKDVLTRLSKFQVLPGSPKKILDIGSGMGHSLIHLKNNVFPDAEYFAIEPSEESIANLRRNGIQVITNDVFSEWEKNNENQFDFIIMRHVLEHFNQPVDILKKVRSVLKEDGLLYVAVPNSMKPTKPLKTHYFRVVHVSYFSPVSLTNAFRLSGINPLHIIDGDELEQFEIFSMCRKGVIAEPVIDGRQFEMQKKIYDQAGSKDLYLTLKMNLVALLRKMRLLK